MSGMSVNTTISIKVIDNAYIIEAGLQNVAQYSKKELWIL